MEFKIAHESRGRIRIQLIQDRMTLKQADLLEAYLCSWPAVQQVTVHERTCCAIIRYEGDRNDLLSFISCFSYTSTEIAKLAPAHTERALNRERQEKQVLKVVSKTLHSAFSPTPIATAGLKLLSSKDAKSVYLHTTAAALRVKGRLRKGAGKEQEHTAKENAVVEGTAEEAVVGV